VAVIENNDQVFRDPAEVVKNTRKPRKKTLEASIGREIGFYGSTFQDRMGMSWDALTYPTNLKTYKLMSKHLVIASAMNLITTMIARVPWRIDPFATNEESLKVSGFITEILNDMDESWQTFISEVSTMNTYGHSVHEVVLRYRRYEEGSKYNDGKVGLKYLPIRSQTSIAEWVYANSGRDLVGIKQNLPNIARYKNAQQKNPFIPIDDLLIFRVNPQDGSPLGTSPLDGCYNAWRYLVTYQEIESTTVSKNLNGVPIMRIPAKNMAKHASEDDAKVYENAKKIVSNVNNGEQAGLVIPSDFDEISGKRYFEFDVVNSTASNTSVVSEIIRRYTNEILQCLSADLLQLGSTNTGSYSLADSKTSLMETVVQSRTNEIANVINNKLIPKLLRANGLPTDKAPKFTFGDISRPDLEVFAKALQQLMAVGLVYASAKNVNYISEQLGLPDLIDPDATQEEVDKLLQRNEDMQSKSGQGYSSATGGLNGTSNKVAKDDRSASNLSNK
jgi:hypothetical protein